MEDDRTLSWSLEEALSDMLTDFSKPLSKHEAERWYRDWLNLSEDDIVIWEDDKIIGFRPAKAMEYISCIIKVDPDGVSIV